MHISGPDFTRQMNFGRTLTRYSRRQVFTRKEELVNRSLEQGRDMDGLPRVNGSMLSEHVGKLVCVVGKITQVSPTGNALKLLTSDKQTINVNLNDQYEDTAGHCIQIIGTVQQNLTVVAEKYISFAGSLNEFDLELYDKMIKLLPRYPVLSSLRVNKDENMQGW